MIRGGIIIRRMSSTDSNRIRLETSSNEIPPIKDNFLTGEWDKTAVSSKLNPAMEANAGMVVKLILIKKYASHNKITINPINLKTGFTRAEKTRRINDQAERKLIKMNRRISQFSLVCIPYRKLRKNPRITLLKTRTGEAAPPR